VVAYAIAIEGPIVVRLLLLLTLGVRAARARRVLQRAGATRVCRYAVTPSLERPTIAYEIGTPAYAGTPIPAGMPGTTSNGMRCSWR